MVSIISSLFNDNLYLKLRLIYEALCPCSSNMVAYDSISSIMPCTLPYLGPIPAEYKIRKDNTFNTTFSLMSYRISCMYFSSIRHKDILYKIRRLNILYEWHQNIVLYWLNSEDLIRFLLTNFKLTPRQHEFAFRNSQQWAINIMTKIPERKFIVLNAKSVRKMSIDTAW